jgi:hypothetical protein
VITLAFVTFALFLLDWALAWAWYLHGPLLWLAAAYAGVQLCGALLVGKTRLPTKTEWKGEVDG